MDTMPPPPKSLLEVCASIADTVGDELKAMLRTATARQQRYDQATTKRIEYGIRSVQKVAARIREFSQDGHAVVAAPSDAEQLAKALSLLRELHPIIANARKGAWRTETLRRIDEITGG